MSLNHLQTNSSVTLRSCIFVFFYNFLFLLFFFFLLPPVFAKEYYLSPTGSDNNDGSQSSPWKTIPKAASLAQPGDIIYLSEGIYPTNAKLNNLHGTSQSPIRFIGTSSDPAHYPTLDGGDIGYKKSTDNPILTLTDCSNLTFERLRFINSTESSIFANNTHYLTLRRVHMDYHKYGLLLRNKSSHILIEHSEFTQSYPDNSTWSSLKESKWEGGAYTSFGGAGMSEIRNNKFYHQFNSIFINRDVRVGNYYDANLFIHDNHFEDIVDDPYEPESYAFNNHFYNNTLKNTHRMVSLAPEYSGLGPIYIYNNVMQITTDITKEAASQNRLNSMLKLDLATRYYPNGVHVFNNTLDANYSGTNSYGVDIVETNKINYYYQYNNIFFVEKQPLSQNNPKLISAAISNNYSSDPLFVSPATFNLQLSNTSPARQGSVAISNLSGFASPNIIASNSPLGAYHSLPSPVYVTPPGGEDSSFPANTSWPTDLFSQSSPSPSPSIQPSISPSPSPSSSSILGDLSGDGHVNLSDYNLLVAHYGTLYSLFDYNNIVANYGK